jgi:hypothetical protein
MHEAAEGVRDAAFNELHLEEFFPRVGPWCCFWPTCRCCFWPCCMWKRGSTCWAALGGVLPTRLTVVIFFLFGECLFCIYRTNSLFNKLLHMRKRGSTGCCMSASAACLSELSLLFCYMKPYGLLSSVLHFIEYATLRFLAGASHDWKKKWNEKTNVSMKIKRVWFFSFCTERNGRWSSRMRKSIVHQKIWLKANCVFI